MRAKTPAKVRQILDGAREVFLNLGFDGASMGDIARTAGVSKGTLYVYFENKAELFSALIADERKHAKREFHLDPQSPDVAADLRRYGRSLLAYISRARNIQSVRTVIAIAEKFPKVGQEFYRDGPQRGLEYLRSYLEAQVAAGRLRIDDCAMAARQLQVLFHTGVINELLYGVREHARRGRDRPRRRRGGGDLHGPLRRRRRGYMTTTLAPILVRL